jgi:hypothetical protein
MTPELKIKRFFTCPNGCSHEFVVEHLLAKGGPCAAAKGTPRTAGPWYCDDCGDSWNIEYTAESIDVTRSNRPRQVKRHVVLELSPQTSPIRFRITRSCDPDLNAGNAEYLYESHSCPTNWLRDIDLVEFEGDQDPHGLIQFVNQFDATPETLEASNSQQPSLMTVANVSTGDWR